ncbi:hypothetical protein BACCELL_05594 [Bacteroides cellulosilyticus DSM 14838]|uniref:Uncharacterized protein n=1 Tax=Bacteroides cellulosilyticus DSM 14838 TaxID=537012 RepID=E2NMP8_9BACE|nr:hypothetical protein BACCELL_05594 [Bacteroides cellulosilyticus DSM 14838]
MFLFLHPTNGEVRAFGWLSACCFACGIAGNRSYRLFPSTDDFLNFTFTVAIVLLSIYRNIYYVRQKIRQSVLFVSCWYPFVKTGKIRIFLFSG